MGQLHRFVVALVAVGFLGLGACSKGGAKHKPGEAGLKALWQEMLTAAQKGDAKKQKALFLSMTPTDADWKAVLKPDWAAKAAARTARRMERVKSLEPEKFGRFLGIKVKRTQIDVYKSTTEEILEYKRDSMAYKKFAGGNRRVAKEMLLPGKSFYVVEMREPGKRWGTKYQLLTYANGHWAMLGKLWRLIKR